MIGIMLLNKFYVDKYLYIIKQYVVMEYMDWIVSIIVYKNVRMVYVILLMVFVMKVSEIILMKICLVYN